MDLQCNQWKYIISRVQTVCLCP